MPNLFSIALTPVLLATLVAPAIAQDQTPATPTPANSQAVISYTPADFAAARPNTALDMINRLPGFSLERGDDVRGFAGAAGNVLIDGNRPTTKSESINDALARITISQVERIDLIRGGATGIDMQGRAVVANVIRKSEDTFQQVVSANGFVFAETGKVLPGWSYQATRRAGEHQFDFQLNRGVSMDDSVGHGLRTQIDVPTGITTYQDTFNEADGSSHTARVNYKGPFVGGVFSANGLIGTNEFKEENDYFNATSAEHYVGRNSQDRGEIGVNYTHPIGKSLELETLALSKVSTGDFRSSGDDGASSSTFNAGFEAGESIGRTILRYTRSPTLSFESGGEIAFNFLEQQVALNVDNAFVSLPASDVRVEELRSEVFAQGTWRPDPSLSLEAGVRYERSTITQSGDTDRERTFNYPKPRFLATWSPDKDNQLRLRIEREVGQLDFGDFISEVNLSSNVLTAGNDSLEPDKTWAYELAYERRFWDNGAAVITLRHEDISDVIDDFPFFVFFDDDGDGVLDDLDRDGQPDQRRVSGPGNIGDGTNDVIQLDLTVPLEKAGVKGGEFKVEALFQESDVRDPVTGESRRISRQRPDDVKISYRQDFPAQKLTVGLGWYAGWSEQRYRLQEVLALDLRNYWFTYLEYKPTSNFTLRGELNNFTTYDFTIERRAYDGPRDTGQITYVDTEDRYSQVIAMIRARWSFD